MPSATDLIIHPEIRALKEDIVSLVQKKISKEEILEWFKDDEKVTSVDNWQA